MSLEAWTAIGASATGVMAIATFLVVWQSRTLSGETRKLAEAAQDSLKVSQGLAATNQDLVKANRDLVKSNEELVRTSHDLVEASREEAAATKELAVEARNDRELACQPWIGIAPPPGGESDFVRVGIPMIVREHWRWSGSRPPRVLVAGPRPKRLVAIGITSLGSRRKRGLAESAVHADAAVAGVLLVRPRS